MPQQPKMSTTLNVNLKKTVKPVLTPSQRRELRAFIEQHGNPENTFEPELVRLYELAKGQWPLKSMRAMFGVFVGRYKKAHGKPSWNNQARQCKRPSHLIDRLIADLNALRPMISGMEAAERKLRQLGKQEQSMRQQAKTLKQQFRAMKSLKAFLAETA